MFQSCLIWGIDTSFENLTPEIEGWIWKTTFALNASMAGDFMQNLSSFLILLVVTCLSIGETYRKHVI